MIQRVVYDTMLFVQTAALRPPRLHGTFKAIEESLVTLTMSDDLFDEIRRVLTDPDTRSILPSLEPPRVVSFLDAVRRSSLWFEAVVPYGILKRHPKDNHLLDLSIAAQTRFLVTWETRLLKLDRTNSTEGNELRTRVPGIRILEPPELLHELRRLERAEPS